MVQWHFTIFNKNSFSKQFKVKDYPFKFINNGLFGYIAHEAIEYFEDIKLDETKTTLDFVINQLSFSKLIDRIVIATTSLDEDNVIEEKARSLGMFFKSTHSASRAKEDA